VTPVHRRAPARRPDDSTDRRRQQGLDQDDRAEAPTDPRDLESGDLAVRSPATRNDSTLPVPEFLELDEACDQFEAAWQGGQRPEMGSYLSRVPVGARVRLFRNLLHLELEYRLRTGEQPDEHSYRERFPEFGDVVTSVFRSQTRCQITGNPPARGS